MILNNLQLPTNVQMWLKRVANGPNAAHVISIENKVHEVAYSHILYIGTLVESSNTDNNVLDKSALQESTVTDVGCPFGDYYIL